MKYSIKIPSFLKEIGYNKLDTKHNPIEFLFDMDFNLICMFFSLTRKDGAINLTVKYIPETNKITEVYSGIFSNNMDENFAIAKGKKLNFFKYIKYYKREMFSIPVENEKLLEQKDYEIYHKIPSSYSVYRTLNKEIQKYYISFYLRLKSEVLKLKEYCDNETYNKILEFNPDFVTFYKEPDKEPCKILISYYKENVNYNTVFFRLKEEMEK